MLSRGPRRALRGPGAWGPFGRRPSCGFAAWVVRCLAWAVRFLAWVVRRVWLGCCFGALACSLSGRTPLVLSLLLLVCLEGCLVLPAALELHGGSGGIDLRQTEGFVERVDRRVVPAGAFRARGVAQLCGRENGGGSGGQPGAHMVMGNVATPADPRWTAATPATWEQPLSSGAVHPRRAVHPTLASAGGSARAAPAARAAAIAGHPARNNRRRRPSSRASNGSPAWTI